MHKNIVADPHGPTDPRPGPQLYTRVRSRTGQTPAAFAEFRERERAKRVTSATSSWYHHPTTASYIVVEWPETWRSNADPLDHWLCSAAPLTRTATPSSASSCTSTPGSPGDPPCDMWLPVFELLMWGLRLVQPPSFLGCSRTTPPTARHARAQVPLAPSVAPLQKACEHTLGLDSRAC